MEFAATAPVASGANDSCGPTACPGDSALNALTADMVDQGFLLRGDDALRRERGNMKLLMQCLGVGAGGFLGAVARFLLSLFCGQVFGTAFPIGTLVINLSGSLLLGWFLTVIGGRTIIPDNVRLAVAVGFVGAYTTFSTFMYESSALLEDGSGIKAMVNLLGSLLLGLLAVRVGMWLAAR